MKIVILALSLLVVVHADLDYTTVNIEELTGDQNSLQTYLNCFIDIAPCTELGAAIKKDITEVVVEACKSCTDVEKHVVRVFLDSFKTRLPDGYEGFKTKFDPEGTRLPKLEAEVANH